MRIGPINVVLYKNYRQRVQNDANAENPQNGVAPTEKDEYIASLERKVNELTAQVKELTAENLGLKEELVSLRKVNGYSEMATRFYM